MHKNLKHLFFSIFILLTIFQNLHSITEIQIIENEIKILSEKQQKGSISNAIFEVQLDTLKGKLRVAQNKIENEQRWCSKADDLYLNAVKFGVDLHVAKENQEIEERKAMLTAAAKAKAKGQEANKGQMERLKEIGKAVSDPKNIASGVLVATALSGGITGAYYGGKLGFNYLDSKIGTKPTLIRESSRHNWKYNLKQYWRENVLGIVPEEISLDEAIFPEDMALKLQMLSDDTKSCVENGLPFRNLLFYGPPGTGKTMVAKLFAMSADMDFAIMSGADFAQFQGGEGISELHKVFDWAKTSKKGLIIFIDEADSALGDRKTLDDMGRKIVNAFLSHTGESSYKVMFIIATNYEDDIDSAVRSRTHKKMYFGLPEYTERLKIFNLYFDKYIVNDVRKIKKDGTHLELSIEISPEINSECLENIATNIDGFSGREIEQMASELRVASYNLGNGLLTKKILKNIVDEKIQEHKHDAETSLKQRERFKAKFNKTENIIPAGISIPAAA